MTRDSLHPQITVFYDGACPMCIREISLMRKLDAKRGRILFEDISPPDTEQSCSIPRESLLARFHVRLSDGHMVDGARAFTEAWACIPFMIWLRALGRFAPTRWVMNRIYDGFLKIRPSLVKRLSRE